MHDTVRLLVLCLREFNWLGRSKPRLKHVKSADFNWDVCHL
jgi:hypothetical protein